MAIEGIQGAGSNLPRTNPLPPAQPKVGAGAAQQTDKASGAQQASGTQQTSSTTSASASNSIMFGGESRSSGNVALALWILSMLLDNSEEKDDSSNQLLLGLAAGLLMASQNKQSSFFFSSTSQATTSTQSFAGPQEVNAAYNTELPAVAADPSAATDPAAQSPTSQVPRIDTTG